MLSALEVRLFGTVLLLAPYALGQLATESVPELIASLRNTEQQQNANRPHMFVVGCGITQELLRERSVARELGSRGEAAVPELDRVFGSLETDSDDSPFFNGWFLFAYARAQGPAAVSRLLQMSRNPKLDSLHITLDRAIALSLGVTSYVSSGRVAGQMIVCRRQEPRDALDAFVLGFVADDRSQLESSLGPGALTALDRLLEDKSWEVLRRELWTAPRGAEGGVGYLFDVHGRWSEPEETLEANRGDGDDPLTSPEVTLDSQFKTSDGKNCARFPVRFKKVNEFGRSKYLVDSTNLKELIGSIGLCFEQP